MKIYYWSPFTSKVATIKAVINSAYSLKKSFKYETTIINSFGEWNTYIKEIKNKKIKLLKKNFNISTSNTNGFFLSRFTYIKIFFFSFFYLKKLLIREKPKYLIIHLITSLPIFLFIFFKFDTKLVLRISGLPKLNFLRKILWMFGRSKISFITTPTIETLKSLKKKIYLMIKKSIFCQILCSLKMIFKLKKRKLNMKIILLILEDLQNKKIKKF